MDAPSRISMRSCQEADHERWRRCGRRGAAAPRPGAGATLNCHSPSRRDHRGEAAGCASSRFSGTRRWIVTKVDRERSAAFSGAPCDRSDHRGLPKLQTGLRQQDRCASGIRTGWTFTRYSSASNPSIEKEPKESVDALTPNRDGSPFAIRAVSTGAKRAGVLSSWRTAPQTLPSLRAVRRAAAGGRSRPRRRE